MDIPFVGRWKTCDPLDFLFEVVVFDLPRAGPVDSRQLDQIDWRPTCDHIVEIRTGGLSQWMIFLQLEHEVLGLNLRILVPLVPELSGILKALKLVSSKEQVNLIGEKGCSFLE